MRGWVDAAKNGEPVDDLIPVNVPPTPEWAEELDSRLNFISKKNLGRIRGLYQTVMMAEGDWVEGWK